MSLLNLPAWSAYATEFSSVRRLLVGFSGGVDSTVLLDLARQWSAQSGLPVLAIHVNHQLSPHATEWQQHCQILCEQWGIPFHSECVTVSNVGQGLEAAARHARYEAFARVAQADDLLLLGHHRDDQLETVFLRLFRGSGVLGLRGIDAAAPWRDAHLLRPLLHFSKTELLAHAKVQRWTWVDDESNASDIYDRNYLRHQVLPVIQQRWPWLPVAVERTAQHCNDAQLLLDERAKEDLLPRVLQDGGLQLTIDRVAPLSQLRQRNLLRYWLRCQQLPVPSEAQLEQILRSVIPAAEDAQPLVSWSGVEIRRFRHTLYAIQTLPVLPSAPIVLDDLESRILPSGGRLDVLVQRQDELQPNLGSHPQPSTHAVAYKKLSSGKVNLRFRQGGETCKLFRRPSRPLKKILQESALPPWWRDRLPLLYVNDTLAVLPGIGVCDGFQAQAGEDAVFFNWVPPMLPQAWRD